jgi:hypothetical protein
MSQEWIGDNALPVAYQALPKEWVTITGMEIFIAPAFEANGGVKVIQHIFRASIDGSPGPLSCLLCLRQDCHLLP